MVMAMELLARPKAEAPAGVGGQSPHCHETFARPLRHLASAEDCSTGGAPLPPRASPPRSGRSCGPPCRRPRRRTCCHRARSPRPRRVRHRRRARASGRIDQPSAASWPTRKARDRRVVGDLVGRDHPEGNVLAATALDRARGTVPDCVGVNLQRHQSPNRVGRIDSRAPVSSPTGWTAGAPRARRARRRCETSTEECASHEARHAPRRLRSI
jgi:hypothetical protein